jgi:hypothetical protein
MEILCIIKYSIEGIMGQQCCNASENTPEIVQNEDNIV